MQKNRRLLPLARSLRRDMTPQERKLWYLFLRTYPIKVYKQRIIESYIVDFLCFSAKLVIEIDGSQHFESPNTMYDNERSAALERYGLKVLRFSNREIDHEFERVCDAIHQEIQSRTAE